MRLKILTSAFLILGFGLLISWPWIVGRWPPSDAPQKERLRFASRFVYYTGGTVIVFAVTGLLAVLLLRQARKEFREEARKNLHELVEGTLTDHGKKQS